MISRIMVRTLRLPFKRKILFVRVSFMLLAVRLSLSVFSFSRVYRFLKRFHPADNPTVLRHPDVAEVDFVCWAVSRAGKLWFGDEGCLPQALVGEMMLLRIGISAQMRVGIRKEEGGALLAHAWVQDEIRTYIGENTSLSRNECQNFPEIQRIVQQQRSDT